MAGGWWSQGCHVCPLKDPRVNPLENVGLDTAPTLLYLAPCPVLWTPSPAVLVWAETLVPRGVRFSPGVFSAVSRVTARIPLAIPGSWSLREGGFLAPQAPSTWGARQGQHPHPRGFWTLRLAWPEWGVCSG